MGKISTRIARMKRIGTDFFHSDYIMHFLHEELTDKIINCFYYVYNKLQYGYLEKVYRNAMEIELKKRGLFVEIEKKLPVYYDNILIGEYYADIVVNEMAILELKTADTLTDAHFNQLKSYLHSTQTEVGLLLNFGPKPQIKRCIFTNDRKICQRNDFANQFPQ